MNSLVTKALMLVLALALSSCAKEEFYHRGRKIAVFQGDMKGMEFKMSNDGTIEWNAEEVNNSQATIAQKQGAAQIINTVGAGIAASGIMSLFK